MGTVIVAADGAAFSSGASSDESRLAELVIRRRTVDAEPAASGSAALTSVGPSASVAATSAPSASAPAARARPRRHPFDVTYGTLKQTVNGNTTHRRDLYVLAQEADKQSKSSSEGRLREWDLLLGQDADPRPPRSTWVYLVKRAVEKTDKAVVGAPVRPLVAPATLVAADSLALPRKVGNLGAGVGAAPRQVAPSLGSLVGAPTGMSPRGAPAVGSAADAMHPGVASL